MTNPTPISTASSSDDLVLHTIDLHNLAYKLRDEGKIAEGLLVLKARDEILNHRLRQPVAGDVVEWDEIAWAINQKWNEINRGEFPMRQEETEALADAILKLIGGGK